MSGCCDFGGGFGGAGGATPTGGVFVEDEGTLISPDPFSTLNFTGPGVEATDGGSETADINIPGNANYFPEQWVVNDVPAATAGPTAASAQVSTNFDTFRVMRAGSITGLETRLTEAVVGGTLTVIVTINGAVTALTVVHNGGTNPTGGQNLEPADSITYVAGDLIGVSFTTSADFLPTSTDFEAAVSFFERQA